MAVPKPLRLTKPYNGGEPEYDSISVATTIIDGDLLAKANGTAGQCGTDPASIAYFAQASGSSLIPGNTTMLLGRVRPLDQFDVNAYHSTAASSTVADADLDGLAQYGVIFATVSSVAAWFLDLEETSTKRVTLLERLDSATTTYPRCRVSFLPAALTFG